MCVRVCRLMCGKQCLNMMFIKTCLAVISTMLYKFPVAVAPVVGLLGLWHIIFSHRWPPYHFPVLNRTRLALDYGIGWIYIVAAVLVMYYCNGIEYLLNKLLPQVPNVGLSKSSPTFTPGERGDKLWTFWLQVRVSATV
jgi:hypothetical protein